jgi:acetoin utilization protein AcuB
MESTTVADIMTPNPITIGPQNSVAKAIRLMRKHGIRRLPVVEDEKLVGIVTSGDLRRITGLSSVLRDQSHENFLWNHVPIENVMTRDPIALPQTASPREAAEILIELKFGGLPILSDGRLVGIITVTDLLRHLIRIEQAVQVPF